MNDPGPAKPTPLPPCKEPDFEGSVLCNDCEDPSRCSLAPEPMPEQARLEQIITFLQERIIHNTAEREAGMELANDPKSDLSVDGRNANRKAAQQAHGAMIEDRILLRKVRSLLGRQIH